MVDERLLLAQAHGLTLPSRRVASIRSCPDSHPSARTAGVLERVRGSGRTDQRATQQSYPIQREAVMADQQAILKTNRGDITLNLFPNHAPETVANFTGLAEGTKEYDAGNGQHRPAFYDGLGFHRVIDGLHDPGRLPAGHRHRRPRLHVQGRARTPSWSSTSPTCSPWPTPARAPTARSSSSPSAPTAVAEPQAHDLRRGGRPGLARRRRRDRHDRDRRRRPPGRAGRHRVRRDRPRS